MKEYHYPRDHFQNPKPKFDYEKEKNIYNPREKKYQQPLSLNRKPPTKEGLIDYKYTSVTDKEKNSNLKEQKFQKSPEKENNKNNNVSNSKQPLLELAKTNYNNQVQDIVLEKLLNFFKRKYKNNEENQDYLSIDTFINKLQAQGLNLEKLESKSFSFIGLEDPREVQDPVYFNIENIQFRLQLSEEGAVIDINIKLTDQSNQSESDNQFQQIESKFLGLISVDFIYLFYNLFTASSISNNNSQEIEQEEFYIYNTHFNIIDEDRYKKGYLYYLPLESNQGILLISFGKEIWCVELVKK